MGTNHRAPIMPGRYQLLLPIRRAEGTGPAVNTQPLVGIGNVPKLVEFATDGGENMGIGSYSHMCVFGWQTMKETRCSCIQ